MTSRGTLEVQFKEQRTLARLCALSLYVDYVPKRKAEGFREALLPLLTRPAGIGMSLSMS